MHGVNSRQRQVVYLVLAVIGLVGCWYFNIQWFGGDGARGMGDFVEAVFDNSASSSISWDLSFGGLAAAVFLVVEGKRVGMRHVWWYLIPFFLVAFAFTFPLFLAMRERHLERVTTA